MKHLKYISISTLVAFSFLSLARSSFAVDVCPNGTGGTASGFKILCTLEPGAFIGSMISFIFVIAAIAALVYLIWGAFRWMTSGGDKTNIETARGHIIAAVIGLVLIFLSYLIMNLVLQFFFGTSLLQNFTIPTLGNTH